MQKLSVLDMVAIVLLIVGGLNWGLVSMGYNAVDMMFGIDSLVSRLVYGLVGLSALYKAWLAMRIERM